MQFMLLLRISERHTPGYAPEMAARLQDHLKQAKDSVASAAKQLQSEGFKAGSRVIESEIRPGFRVSLRSGTPI